jgi:uncharacterized protein (TIGR00730 family)
MKRLCVYCGSSIGTNPLHRAAAESLGELMAQLGIGLVYGGGNVGLMGVIADAHLRAGGEVVGVIPKSLMDRELGHTGITDLRIVGSMHERKQLMVDLSDGFIALPGGIGTLEELFETFTWLQLGFHTKPCGILNVDGFFNHLQAFLQNVTANQFLLESHHAALLVESDAPTLLNRMATFHSNIPRTAPKRAFAKSEDPIGANEPTQTTRPPAS